MEPESIRNAYRTLAEARATLNDTDINLTPEQYIALSYIAEEGTPKLGDLATYLGCTPAVVTGLVDRLEKRKYVKRIPITAGGDRRRVNVAVTVTGAAAIKRVETALRAAVAA